MCVPGPMLATYGDVQAVQSVKTNPRFGFPAFLH